MSTHFIAPGSPFQNGLRESFPSQFQDGLLYETLFTSVAESIVLAGQYRAGSIPSGVNTERPHQSFGYLAAQEFRQRWMKEDNNQSDSCNLPCSTQRRLTLPVA